MIRLRHLRHPLRSARSLYCRVSRRLEKMRAEREFRDARRGSRDRCWCGGSLGPFALHPSYGICAQCGCYVNLRPLLPEEFRRLYSFDVYWHGRQTLKGHPRIENRVANDHSDGRVDCWLHLIEQYGPATGRVVEVGCAHGALLSELRSRGYTCVGVEPDERTADWTRKTTGIDIRAGFFPEAAVPDCDLFLSFDVIEHTLDPVAFLRSAAERLQPQGVAILQTPIDRYDYLQPPFGEMFEKVFDDVEHQFIFVDESIRQLATVAGLRVLAESQWQLAHEIVVLQHVN